MRVIFLLFDYLLFQYSNQVSESLTLMDQTLLDVMELDVMVHLMVQDLGQDLVQDLVQVMVVLTLVVFVMVLIVLMYWSQIHLAWKVLMVQKVHLLFLEASEVSEG